MLVQLKTFVRRFVPRSTLGLYHRTLARCAAAVSGNPTAKMLTIGVTGTKGKSTTAYLIAHIFEHAGRRSALTSTALFKSGPREWLNSTKMTMLGRFGLHRFLRRARREGCEVAVVESSSEGLAQWRHAGIHYDIAVFTNLTPEHIESHGSFAAYRAAKGRLFATLGRKTQKRKTVRGESFPTVSVVNADDQHADFFAAFPADEHWAFGTTAVPTVRVDAGRYLLVEHIALSPDGARFLVGGVAFRISLLGRSSVMNAAAAIAVARSRNIPFSTIAEALSAIQGIPGRFERIEEGQEFAVIVDYAHEPESFTQLYEAVALLSHKRIIHVFGSTGGGRDTSRRPILGGIAGAKADIVIVTTDDPYDEDPQAINDAVIAGAEAAGKKMDKNVFSILDRKEAIRTAVRMALPGDILLITGKGSEQSMVLRHGKKIAWDDREIARAAIHTQGRGAVVYE
jgi:UDP-N-acetylmuramoyl-L-alanyl-D-glutamate--2,6-diaminopimelate ligase